LLLNKPPLLAVACNFGASPEMVRKKLDLGESKPALQYLKATLRDRRDLSDPSGSPK
jgi:hypothetical protein